MLYESEHRFFSKVLQDAFNHEVEVSKVQHVSGGDINHAARITSTTGEFFIKWNQFPESDIFEKESSGLSLLAASCTIDVPKVLGIGQVEKKNYLILENINKAHHGRYFWEDFGEKVAKLHQSSSNQFGLDDNNYIGRLPQLNTPTDKWIDFFITNRLHPQLKMARSKGIIPHTMSDQFEILFSKLPDLIPDEKPSLLHGDLWSGNFMCGPNHQAWIFDPAVYFGHREMEIAFTHLFGGYDERFYQSYESHFPLEPGFEERVDIHNLYPLLVHVNLFGTSYLSGIQRTISRFT